MQSGGRIVHYDDNHVLFSVGEFRNRFLAQEKENINGKVIKVNIVQNNVNNMIEYLFMNNHQRYQYY